MISRFNFYDVYGYFLPGLVLLSLLWLPFGVIHHLWPTGELITALIAILFAYIAGHVTQTMAIPAFPSTAPDSHGHRRYPSDIILDEGDETFSPEFKKKLADQIQSQFDIDVTGESPSVSARRQDAFFLCRSALIKDKTISYGEQFEGMYALMRGTGAAFLLGVGNYAGWGLAILRPDLSHTNIAISLIAAVASAMIISRLGRKPGGLVVSRVSFLCVGWALLCAGYLTGIDKSIPRNIGEALVAIVATVFLAQRCFGAYEFFARQFAMAIYRDFYAHEKTKSDGGVKDSASAGTVARE
jgi:hypothetical protein